MRSSWFFIIAFVIGVGGCFNPDLGDSPYKCATTGKRCPSGYQCNPKNRVCVPDNIKFDAAPKEARVPKDGEFLPSKEGPVYLDGAIVQSSKGCLDESSEPNNTSAQATELHIQGDITDWEICYPGDVDHYAIQLDLGDKLVDSVQGLEIASNSLDDLNEMRSFLGV